MKYLQLGLVEGDKVSLVDLEAAAGPAKVWEVQHAVRGEQQIGLQYLAGQYLYHGYFSLDMLG